MLVLSRKIGEEILIGDGIRLRLLDIKGCRVKIGIAADVKVPIVRGELLEHRQGRDKPATDRDAG